jgi:hypothetical protein
MRYRQHGVRACCSFAGLAAVESDNAFSLTGGALFDMRSAEETRGIKSRMQ